MWRALVFIGLLCLAAFGAVWLADRPGTVLVTFGGYEVQTSVSVAAIGLAGTALLLAMLWSIVTTIMGLPSRLSFASKARRPPPCRGTPPGSPGPGGAPWTRS